MIYSRDKISCLLFVQNSFELVIKSVQCFINQTFPHKELFVFARENWFKVKKHIDELGRDDIFVPRIDPRLNKGEVKNLGCELATGNIICNWEDDDLYNNKRLTTQFHFLYLKKADAVVFTDHLRYFPIEKSIYWLELGNNKKYPDQNCLHGSAMFRKSVFETVYDKDHDPDCFLIKRMLSSGRKIFGLKDFGFQYVYTYHGNNSLIMHSTNLKIIKCKPENFLLEQQNQIEKTLRQLSLTVSVRSGSKKIWDFA